MTLFAKILWKLGNFVEPWGAAAEGVLPATTAVSPLADAVRTGQYPLAEIERRYARYQAAEISIAISRHDDMYIRGLEGNLDHYLQVGRGAIDLIVAAMVAAKRTGFGKDPRSSMRRRARHASSHSRCFPMRRFS